VGDTDGHSRSSGSGSSAASSSAGGTAGARGELARQIPRRPRVSWWIGLLLALGFAALVTPALTAERWLPALGVPAVKAGEAARVTVRVPPFAGVQALDRRVTGGGVIIARGDEAVEVHEDAARLVAAARPGGAAPYLALFALAFVFAALFTHHMQRSTRGRLLRVQLVSLVTIAALAIAVKALMLTTALSILVVPVALAALVPTMALDRVVGLATGVLAALITSLLVPFDVTVAILLLVQAGAAGLLVAEAPKQRWKAALLAGLVTTLLTAATLLLIAYLTRNAWPQLRDPLRSPWIAAAIGPAIATLIAVPLLPLYQLLVGEITHGKLVELEDLSHPLLRQIAERAPGTWQHSLMMANMAEIAANAIGASGRLVRVGAYFHDLGKSLQPKYFIENLDPGETSPHDQLPPEVSCSAIFEHVTEGIVVARRAGLHERIVDFMHMHHGNGVLEYFWGKAKEHGNPRGFTIEQFRYPGHPPQSRETALLAICDAVEAASRTLKKPEPPAIDALVQRIVYGKLHLGQLDESGLSMADLRRVNDSLRETIRHANHGRIEYPWQKAQQDASASMSGDPGTQPRLDSLDRRPRRETAVRPPLPPAEIIEDGDGAATVGPRGRSRHLSAEAYADTSELDRERRTPDPDEDLGIVATAPVTPRSREEGSEPPAASSAPHGDSLRSQAPPAGEPAGRRAPIGEDTQVGRAPAPDPRDGLEEERGPRETQLGLAQAQAGPRAQSTQLGLGGEARTRPPPPPGARQTPPDLGVHALPTQPPFPTVQIGSGSIPLSDQLDTPVMPAMLGERVRAESRTEVEPPPAAPPAPTTLPGHRPPGGSLATRLPAVIAEAARPRTEDWTGDTATSAPRREDSYVGKPPRREDASAEHRPPADGGDRRRRYLADASTTEPSLPQFELPAQRRRTQARDPAPPVTEGNPRGMTEGNPRGMTEGNPRGVTEGNLRRTAEAGSDPEHPWSTGLAARVDAVLLDEWSNETPVVAPTRAELRALLGAPDPTRQQSIDELEALHRAVEELPSEPGLLAPPPRRAPYPTAEVDPDQIEAAIELAPPARRSPNTIEAARPKKPK
jgi:hypothetical protein